MGKQIGISQIFCLHQLEWEVFEDVIFSAFTAFSFGESDSEFGIQDKNFRIRLRAYF